MSTPSPNDSDNTSATTNPISLDHIIHINSSFNTKLTDANFLTWKNQIQLIIEGHDLDSHLLHPPPEATIRAITGTEVLNPNYLFWKRQDKLLNAWIRSSLSDSILSQVMSARTCRDLWLALDSYFTTTSRARLQVLKSQLQSISKGQSNCTEYLDRIRKLADELAFIGYPVPEEDLVSYAINGLGSGYTSLKDSILTARCHSTFTLSVLRGLLLSHESMDITNPDTNPVALLAGKYQKNRYQTQSKSSQASNSSSFNTRSSTNPTSNTNFFSSGSQPSNSVIQEVITLISSGKVRIPCQICQKMGHLTTRCYKRYDKDPNWRPPPRYNAFNAHLLDNADDPDPSNWILDSGANNHVTNDPNALTSFFSYKGPDKLQIGTGQGLEITHIGSQKVVVGSYTFTLHNVLCVPTFSTKLISLSQLLIDNPSVSINFNSSSCFFKDLTQP
jgi:gag-polypeptide of LTR copia-type